MTFKKTSENPIPMNKTILGIWVSRTGKITSASLAEQYKEGVFGNDIDPFNFSAPQYWDDELDLPHGVSL
jgi:hypothetical protein